MTYPVVTFPDVVALVAGYLADNIAAPVHKRVPNPRPAEFVTVERIGGTAALVVDSAQVMIHCWADTDADVADLAAEVRGVLGTMRGAVIDGTQVYRVDELSGPADVPDPDSDQPRMRWTVAVQTRGASAAS